jgi:hypothetical protein
MRMISATTLILVPGLALPAAADTTTTANGAGASVAIVSGSNGGTTIVVNSDKPCRTEIRATAQNRLSGSTSSRIDTGPGGLSGSSSAAPNGVSVDIGHGQGSFSAGNPNGIEATNQAGSGECIVVIQGPKR